mgnify:CR=1 FL=1
MAERRITREKYNRFLRSSGASVLILGVILKAVQAVPALSGIKEALSLKSIYDLPVFLMIIGAVVALKGVAAARRHDAGEEAEDVVLSRKSFGTFLTNYAILLAMLVLVLVICVIQPRFMQVRVALDVLTQSSTRLIIALGICFTLLIAGTDLSAGRMVGLAAVVSTSMLQTASYANRFFPDMPQVSVWLPILLAVLACMAFGALNGFLVAKYDMHPFIATLATQVIIYGACSLYFDMPPNNSQPIGGIRPDFTALGQMKVFASSEPGGFPGISILIPIAAVICVLIWFILNKTVFGKNVYAIGGNEMAAKVSGISVPKTQLKIYALIGLLAGLAGVILTARTGSGAPSYGNIMELDVITATVIGGTSFNGGIGTVWGVMVGTLIIGVINNGLSLLNVSPYWQMVVKGGIIVIAIIIDERKNR